jgi:hypothetical protein
MNFLLLIELFVSGCMVDVTNLPAGARNPEVYQNNTLIVGSGINSLYERFEREKGIYDVQLYIDQLENTGLTRENEIDFQDLGFSLPVTKGNFGIRDGGKTRQSFKSRRQKYYDDTKNPINCKAM